MKQKRTRITAGWRAFLFVALFFFSMVLYRATVGLSHYSYALLYFAGFMAILCIVTWLFGHFHGEGIRETLRRFSAFAYCVFLSFILIEFTSSFRPDFETNVLVVNGIIYVCIYLMLSMVLRSSRAAIWAMYALSVFISLFNVISYIIRGIPFSWSDIAGLRTALAVSVNYKGIFGVSFLCAVLLYLSGFFATAHVMRYGKIHKHTKTVPVLTRFLGITVSAAILTGIVLFHGSILEYNSWDTSSTGYLLALLFQRDGADIKVPDGYDPESLSAFPSVYPSSGTEDSDLPDILVIMDESFSFLTDLDGVETSEPLAPFYSSLEENCVKGYVYTSLIGGGSSDSEYEFLSGDSTLMFNGNIVYTGYIHSFIPTLFSRTQELGYETTFYHPWDKAGWNRANIYDLFGADRTVYLNDQEGGTMSLIREELPSDSEDFETVLEMLSSAGPSPQFLMNVTIQNHASYSKRESKNELSIVGTGKDYPEAERYVSLIRDTDDALKDLVSELDQLDRKVLLVFFGDHRPYLSDGFYGDYGLTEDTLEERMEFSKTPYLIWANYDLSETADEDVLDMVGTSGNDTSLNYLSTAAFKLGGIPLSGYQEYLWDLSQEYPVLNRFGAWDKDGNLISVDDYAAYPDLVTYQYIIYNHMFDSKNRLESFFD
jgi:hypothetical protein